MGHLLTQQYKFILYGEYNLQNIKLIFTQIK